MPIYDHPWLVSAYQRVTEKHLKYRYESVSVLFIGLLKQAFNILNLGIHLCMALLLG